VFASPSLRKRILEGYLVIVRLNEASPKGLALKLFLKLNLFCRELSVILCLLKLENHLSSHRLLKPNAPHKFLTPSL
jgi:hypothetical protein